MSAKQGGIKYHFRVFGMTEPGIEPRSFRPSSNTLKLDNDLYQNIVYSLISGNYRKFVLFAQSQQVLTEFNQWINELTIHWLFNGLTLFWHKVTGGENPLNIET